MILQQVRQLFGYPKITNNPIESKKINVDLGKLEFSGTSDDATEHIDKKRQNERNDRSFVWCLLGNVVNERFHGEAKEVKHGTRHFSPGTKVYCIPPQWGDGYEQIKVIGLHKHTKKLITIVMPSSRIENWRLKQVFKPKIKNILINENGWTDSEIDKNRIIELTKWLTERDNK